ncbi:MAG: hypothetical protein AAGA56_25310 [Myxococcota bacterium]
METPLNSVATAQLSINSRHPFTFGDFESGVDKVQVDRRLASLADDPNQGPDYRVVSNLDQGAPPGSALPVPPQAALILDDATGELWLAQNDEGNVYVKLGDLKGDTPVATDIEVIP